MSCSQANAEPPPGSYRDLGGDENHSLNPTETAGALVMGREVYEQHLLAPSATS